MSQNNNLESLSLHLDSANEFDVGTSEEERAIENEETSSQTTPFHWTCPRCHKWNGPTMEECIRCKAPKPIPSILTPRPNNEEAIMESTTRPIEAWKEYFKTNWFATYNFNVDSEDYIAQQEIIEQVVTWLNDYEGRKNIKRYAVGFEIGKDTKHFHAHVVVSFNRSFRPTALNTLTVGDLSEQHVHPNLNFLAKAENVARAVKYCCKKDTKRFHEEGKDYFIYDRTGQFQAYAKGEFRKQSEKKTNRDIFFENIDDIQAGKLENIDQYFLFNNMRKCIEYRDYLDNAAAKFETLDHCRLIIIYGQPGTGKSSIAVDFAEALNMTYYIKAPNKWWHAYDNQEIVIADEIRTDLTETLEAEFKIWGDRHSFQIDIKNKNRLICPKWFIITTNYTPHQLFNKGYQTPLSSYYQAIWRRAGYGKRINEMDTIGMYMPKSVWKDFPPERRAPFEKLLQDFVDNNSIAHKHPQNELLTA